MVGKLVTGLLEAFLKVLGIDPAPEWVTKLYGFFDDLPLKAKEFFKGIMDFFTGGGFLGNLIRSIAQKFGVGKKYNEP